MIEKLRMQTPNGADEKFRLLAELFPNAVTETLDDDGNPVRAIDKDILAQEINTRVLDGREERYQFTWPDKRQAIAIANEKTSMCLRPCREESVDFDTTENLYIEGDNLKVLKVLRESYMGKVKMIYIDPPYNTGKDFVYKDNFALDGKEYVENSGQFDEEGNKLILNPETNGRFHTDWLNFIFTRLKVAWDFLSEDGVLFISIDDNEHVNLRKVCDEIFGSEKLLATFKWNRTAKAPSLSDSVRIKFEYVLCYEKKCSNKLFGKESYNSQAPLLHLPNKRALIIFPPNSVQIPNSFDKGVYSEKYQVELLDFVEEENGLNKNEFSICGCFAWSQSKINEYVNRGYKFTVKKSFSTIYYDLVDSLFIAPADVISMEECGVKRNTDSKEEMKELNIPFDYAKPVTLPKYLLKMVSYEDKDALILDFFSGSGTTAHAVMQLNAEDGGNRKFIMVQLQEECDEKSEAFKAGYKNICEIGKERIRRAGKKIREEMGLQAQGVDMGFRVLKCDSSNMEEVFYTPSEVVKNRELFKTDNVKPDRTAEDLLFQVMLELNIPLSARIAKITLGGREMFSVNDGYLLAVLDGELTESAMRAVAAEHPVYFVTRDSALQNDANAANLEQIFKTISPESTLRVL